MSTLADLDPETRRRFTRMYAAAVPAKPAAVETGFTGWSRETAEKVCAVLHGTAWRAAARAPYYPHPENETHGQLIIAVHGDRGWRRILHTHTVPAHTDRHLFTLTVDGRPVPYGLRTGELPHSADVIAAALWRYAREIPVSECTAIWCGKVPTVATYTGSLCAEHAKQYGETGTYW